MLLIPHDADCLDIFDPLEPDHPLNIGLEGEWAIIPNSGYWGRAKIANLVNNRPEGAWVSPTTRLGFDVANFSGASNYVNCGNNTIYDIGTGAFTFGVFMKWTGTKSFFALNKTAGAVSNGYEFLINSGNVKGVGVRLNSGTSADIENTSGTWNDGNPHLLTATRDKSGNVTLYVDASSAGTATYAGSLGSPTIPLQFNARNGSVVGAQTWQGYSWFVYPNRCLTVADVRALYEEIKAGNPNRWRWAGKRKFWLPAVFAAGGGTTPITPSGSCAATGTLALAVSKSLAGSLTPTGSLANIAGKLLAGSLTPAGTVTKLVGKFAAGSSTASGALAKQAAKSLAGSSTPTGSLANQAQKSLSGSCTPSGASSYLKVALLAVSGSVTAAGSLVIQVAKSLTGSLTGSGSLAKQVNKPLAGSTTPTGSLIVLRAALASFAGTLTAAGSLVKSVLKYLAGSSTPTGDLTTEGGNPGVEDVTPGGTFRRTIATTRVFRRTTGVSRVFRWRPRTMATILQTTLPKDSDETVAYIFDFSQFDEARAGETLQSATVPASVPAGLTIGSPSVIDARTNDVPASLGISVTVAGGTAGTTYDLECRATFSGGGIRVVKGRVEVE